MIQRFGCAVRWAVNTCRKPIRPGSPIRRSQGVNGKYGTFGCVIRLANVRYILTCAHVLHGSSDDSLVRAVNVRIRNTPDGKERVYKDGRVVGCVVGESGPKASAVDCALVSIRPGSRVYSRFPKPIGRLHTEICTTDELQIVHGSAGNGRVDVQIVGARSGPVSGRAKIGAFAFRVRNESIGEFQIDSPCIEIKPSYVETADFCQTGDSGSLVVTKGLSSDPRPLGLLISMKKDSLGVIGYAVPIQRVLGVVGSEARIDPG